MDDSQWIRAFVGIDLSREGAPDATAQLHFRRLLERHDLTRAIFAAIQGYLAEQGLLLREGTIVDATIIATPPSTKNRAKARDPEMHQAKNTAQLFSLFALANLVLARRLLPPQGVSAS